MTSRVVCLMALAFACATPAGAETLCVLSAERLAAGDDQTAEVTFSASIACAPGVVPERGYDHTDFTTLPFAALPGERVIIGASLTDEAPSTYGNDTEPQPDTDFPIRYVTIPPPGEDLHWSFSAQGAVVAGYDHLIMRVWNTAALVDCPQGRDGCERFGYVLLWDQLRAADALELALP